MHFRACLEWLVQTWEYFATARTCSLLIRGASGGDQRLSRRRASRFSPSCESGCRDSPPNIIVVPPESGLSTYALMSLCNSAIIYGTKMGVELTSVGLPVIVAGEAWIRNKGITLDASSPEEYFRLLAQLRYPSGSRRRSWHARGGTRITFSSTG
jgi:hypothetical protein